MIDDQIAQLTKNYVIKKGKCAKTKKEYYSICINKPSDFIYDTSDIIVHYFPEDNIKTIICDEIPQKIKENVYKFNFLEINEFIELFQNNLTVFLAGKIPELEKKEEPSKEFKFPVHNNITPNLICDISKTNILLICCMNLNLTIKCSKCQDISSITSNRACKKCGQEIGFVYVPTIDSDSLGFLQMKKCEFICFNPMKYHFNCSECQKTYESDEIGLKTNYTQKCNGCFKEMKFKINKLDFYIKKDVKVKEGEELPDKGTCKHYKKSFRWFRFSCCNSLYPCDVCHNEQTNHKAETAYKMVCGLCSKEQSVKQECDCGMDLKRKHTQFWEGGKGNRNKATLSKNDSKKYKN